MTTGNNDKTILKKDVSPISHKKNWKDYLGESVMIVFSVLLALILSEFASNIHERQNTKIQLTSIVNELNHNETALEELHTYNLKVLKNIDSALSNKQFQKEIITNDEFHLNLIAPQGVLYRNFESEAWS